MKACGGIQVTASHNPAEYNGMKLSRHEARPVSGDHGIPLLEQKVLADEQPVSMRSGDLSEGAIFEAYGSHVLSFLRAPADALQTTKPIP